MQIRCVFSNNFRRIVYFYFFKKILHGNKMKVCNGTNYTESTLIISFFTRNDTWSRFRIHCCYILWFDFRFLSALSLSLSIEMRRRPSFLEESSNCRFFNFRFILSSCLSTFVGVDIVELFIQESNWHFIWIYSITSNRDGESEMFELNIAVCITKYCSNIPSQNRTFIRVTE